MSTVDRKIQSLAKKHFRFDKSFTMLIGWDFSKYQGEITPAGSKRYNTIGESKIILLNAVEWRLRQIYLFSTQKKEQ